MQACSLAQLLACRLFSGEAMPVGSTRTREAGTLVACAVFAKVRVHSSNCAACRCRPGTWFGKPSQASAVACAAHGWTNSAADVLKCPACQQTLAFTASSTLHGHDADTLVQDFVAQLSSKHEAFCVWHDQGSCASNEILPFPAAPQKLVCEAFVGRIAELGQLEGLPCLGGLGIATMTSQCLAQLMALLDATAVPLQVCIR